MRTKKANAYELTYKKTVLVVSPAAYEQRLGYNEKRSEKEDQIVGQLRSVIDRRAIKGREKFELSELATFDALLARLRPAAEKKAIKQAAKEKADTERWDREFAARRAAEAAALAKSLKEYPLPIGLEASDLQRPGYEKSAYLDEERAPGDYRRRTSDFEIWFIAGYGWVVPTLSINGQTREGSYRTYAARVDNGSLCRVGHGPHVKLRLTVYVSKANRSRLKLKFLPLIEKGSEDANQVRDRISTRRAQTALRRRRSGFGF